MKYIKLFELLELEQYSKYWKIRTDTPYYNISLDKIKMPKDIQKDYLDSEIRRRYFKNLKFVFIAKEQAGTGFEWTWSGYETEYRKKFRNMGDHIRRFRRI